MSSINESLECKAKEYRLEILDVVYRTKKGHIGGCYSCIDILNVLYNKLMRPEDKFFLSKGHSTLALYVVLRDKGVISETEYSKLFLNGSWMGAHPDFRVSGIEISSGSLGNGLGIATGMAIADKISGNERKKYVLTGDAECYEGSIWEAVMYAGHMKLNELIWFVDRNKQAVLDFTEDCNRLDSMNDRVRAMGWDIIEIDGNSYEKMEMLFDVINNSERNKPLCVIANTIKGYGVSFMEKKLQWHHKCVSNEEYIEAKREIEDGR